MTKAVEETNSQLKFEIKNSLLPAHILKETFKNLLEKSLEAGISLEDITSVSGQNVRVLQRWLDEEGNDPADFFKRGILKRIYYML